MSRSIRSIALALILVFTVSAGAVHALPRPAQVTPTQPADLFAAAWEWLTELFAPLSGQGATAESRDKAGWEMDPNGLNFVSSPYLSPDPTVPLTLCGTGTTTCR